jgi:hypothetical protein
LLTPKKIASCCYQLSHRWQGVIDLGEVVH